MHRDLHLLMSALSKSESVCLRKREKQSKEWSKTRMEEQSGTGSVNYLMGNGDNYFLCGLDLL